LTKRAKKQFIAVLLFICCAVAGWLLFITPTQHTKSLNNFSQADSLLRRILSDFNVPDSQIRSSSVQIDSTFSRKKYTIALPPDFSKTQLHATLKNQLFPYGITLPGQVRFPERDMMIHLYYNNSVIGTLELITDEDLQMQRSFGSIVVAYNGQPPESLLKSLIAMGEPIPLAISLQPPFDKPEWWVELTQRYRPVWIWPDDPDSKTLFTDDDRTTRAELQSLGENFSGTTLLSVTDYETSQTTVQIPKNLLYIDGKDALILNKEMGKAAFNQSFRTFVQQSRTGARPIAIIQGTEQTMQWVQNELNTYKKGGLTLITPQNKSNP
jgi:hypothetical protein